MPDRASVRADLAREAASSEARLVASAQALVATASPNPPSDTADIADVAAELLAAIPGIEIERIEPEPRVVSLIGRIRGGRRGRRLVFNGHLDTFPIGEDLGWTVPPLGGLVRDGRLYGRGVSDMKAGVACSLLAATLLAERRDAWSGEIVLTLAGDEENMGSLGSGWMLENREHAGGAACICGDVGSPSVVRFGEKGLYWIELEATGSPAHGAHVHKGTNAIDRLREALDALKRLEDLPVRAPALVTEAIRLASPASEALSGSGETRTLGRVTVNIGLIEGGVSPNLVPVRARASADIRLPVGVTTAEIDAALAASLGAIGGISWCVVRRFEPSFTPPGDEIVRRVAAVATEILGEAPVVNMRVGGSDARWYRRYGVPTVVYGPTPFGMGGPDEHVLVRELVQVAGVHALAAFDFLTDAPAAAPVGSPEFQAP